MDAQASNSGSLEYVMRKIVPPDIVRVKRPKVRVKKEPFVIDGYEPGRISHHVGIANSPIEFAKEFRSRIKRKFPDAVMCGLMSDTHQAGDVLDILTDNDCRNADTIRTWMSWYLNELNREQAKVSLFVSVVGLRNTWGKFRKARPNAVSSAPQATSPVADMSDIIGKQLKIIFSTRPVADGIRTSCELYGIVITADFMRRGLGMSAADVASSLSSVIVESGSEPQIARLIFDTTCQYASGPAAEGCRLMSDWCNRFPAVWKAAGRNETTPPNKQYVKYVLDYFSSPAVKHDKEL
jgi:hypothetical protein